MAILENIWFLAIFLCVKAEILVTTPNGVIQGRQEYSQRGISFYAFQEIPFGKPPIGELRFKSPQPAEKWEGVLNATQNRKICMQQGIIDDPTLDESEDCLYLNVYTPEYPSLNASLAVMFYIHGGGYVTGYANFDVHGPHYWMEHGVIMVTTNYRVGLWGFLSTEDESIPGNYGLKDQQLALKWVQENIASFGGDPTKVTIIGHSAGSSAVGYQLMNKKNEGLFRGAIMLSGSNLSPWGYQRNARKYAYMMAAFLNSTFNENSNSADIRDYFLSITADNLKYASFNIPTIEDQMFGGFLFAPVIEPEHEEAFITEPMYSAIEEGHMLRVPIIIGICSEECIWGAANETAFKAQLETYDGNVTLFVNDNMHLTDESVRIEAGKAIRSAYVDDLIQDNLGRAVKFFSDNEFGRGIVQHAKLQSEYSDVFFYQFSYYGPDFAGWRPNVEGADRINHADDLVYIWVKNNNSDLNTYTDDDILASVRFRTVFTNFAKTLNPTSDNTDILGVNEWPTVKPKNFQYLNINNTLDVLADLKQDVHPKLVEIYEKYGVKPFDTF